MSPKMGFFSFWLGLVFQAGFFSCASMPSGPFNHDHMQDPSCYAKYGGQWGYCDRSIYYNPGEPPK